MPYANDSIKAQMKGEGWSAGGVCGGVGVGLEGQIVQTKAK